MGINDLLQSAGVSAPNPRNVSTSNGVGALVTSAQKQTAVSATPAAPAEQPTAQPSIMSRLLNIPKDFVSGIASSYGNAAQAIPEDISTASSELQKEQQEPNTLGNEIKQTDSLVKGG